MSQASKTYVPHNATDKPLSVVKEVLRNTECWVLTESTSKTKGKLFFLDLCFFCEIMANVTSLGLEELFERNYLRSLEGKFGGTANSSQTSKM